MKRAAGDSADAQARAAAATRICKLRRLLTSGTAGEARRAASLIEVLVQRHGLDDAALQAAAELDAEPASWQHERQLRERPPQEMLLAQLRASGRSARNGAGSAAGEELGLCFGSGNALARSLLASFVWSHRSLTTTDLAARDCSSRTLGELLELCGEAPGGQLEALLQLDLGRPACGHSDASMELAAAIADMYSTLRAPDVLPLLPATCMTLTLQALVSEGDLVVCQWPANPQLFDLFADLGCRVLFWRPEDDAHEGMRYSVDTLERVLSSSSPAIDPTVLVLALPSEPIGWLPTQSSYLQLIAACKKRGTYILADETFGWSVPEAQRLTPLADACELGISISSLGGPFGLTALHCGWVACTNRTLLRRIEELYTYSSDKSVSSLNDRVALLALQPRVRRALLDLSVTTLAANRALALRVFARPCFRLTPPLSGPSAFVQLVGDRALSASEFCTRLALACGVLCVPDACYQRRRGPVDLMASASSWLCVSFGGSHAAEGMRLLDGAVGRLGSSLGVLEAVASPAQATVQAQAAPLMP